MTADYSKLIGKIAEKHKTRRQFCKEIGITYQSFLNKIRNKTQFSSEEIYKAIIVLGLEIANIPEYFFCIKS